MDEAERMGISLTNLELNGVLRPYHYQYANEFGKAIQEDLELVLDQSTKMIERLNAVRMMSLAAKLPMRDSRILHEDFKDEEKSPMRCAFMLSKGCAT